MGSRKSSRPAAPAEAPQPKEVIITGNEAKSRTKYPAPGANVDEEESGKGKRKPLLRSETSSGLNVG